MDDSRHLCLVSLSLCTGWRFKIGTARIAFDNDYTIRKSLGEGQCILFLERSEHVILNHIFTLFLPIVVSGAFDLFALCIAFSIYSNFSI